MASFQVEIPSSSERFGLILRDRNHRYDQNAVVLQKNLKALVKDQNSENLIDSWIEHQNINKKPIVESKRNEKTGAFSLVQIWEARLNRSNGGNSPSRSDSEVSFQDSHISDESEIEEAKSVDPTVEIESDSGGRVAHLIRRLRNQDGENGGCGSDGGLSIIKTPGLRGRQAFTDLLMRLERDRHRELETLLERNAVSRFTQRGRLQTMLRLRNLNRCLAVQDRNRFNPKTTGLNRIESGSTVLHLREKLRANAVAVNAASAVDQRKDHHRSAETNKETEVSRDNTGLKKGLGVTLEASFAERLRLRNHKKQEEATLCTEEEIVNGTVESEMNCLQLQETRKAKETYNDSESEKTSPNVGAIQELRLPQNQIEEKMEKCMQGSTKTEDESNEMDQFLEQQETTNLNGWEEQEEYEDEKFYHGETNNDWLSEISRPRSYWEELRKSRYLEVMNTRSDKEDIRRLLERRTVTDFLESGLREKIDNLMMSRVQTHSNNHSEKWELQQEEEEQKNEIEEDDRDDSSRSSSSHMFASSPAGSWSSQDTEVTYGHVLSIHTPHSSEMELISGMRSQIQQLQLEMSLLRDSVKTCLDANANLQQSVHRENPLKRKCCVCDETQVEAVLYKCGHMCTCLKCANELHCNGGKCPICRAQIVDVVRVFFDTRN